MDFSERNLFSQTDPIWTHRLQLSLESKRAKGSSLDFMRQAVLRQLIEVAPPEADGRLFNGSTSDLYTSRFYCWRRVDAQPVSGFVFVADFALGSYSFVVALYPAVERLDFVTSQLKKLL